MKKWNPLFLLLALSLAPSLGHASPITADVISAPSGLQIQSRAATFNIPTPSPANSTEALLSQTAAQTVKNKTFDETSNVYKMARGIYDFATNGGASGANISLGMGIPANSILKKVWLDVVTQPVGATGTPALSVGAVSSVDVFVSTAATALTTGSKDGVEDNTAANGLKVTSAKNLFVNIKNGSLSAGTIVVFVEYLISQ